MPLIPGKNREGESPSISPQSVKKWREFLLAGRDVSIESLAYNYLGRDKARLEPADILSRLSAMCMHEDFGKAAISMMDRLDTLIIGLIVLSGSLEISALRRILEAEYSYHDTDYRLANLVERLLIFREIGDCYRANPYLESLFMEHVAKADILFGPFPHIPPTASSDGPAVLILSIQDLFLVFYALCLEDPDPTLKSGQLSAKAKRRIKEISPGDIHAQTAVEAIVQALLRTNLAVKHEKKLSVEFDSLIHELGADPGVFPFKMLFAWTDGYCDAPYRAAWKVLTPFLERGFAFSEEGLKRLSAMTQGVSRWYEAYGNFAEALEAFGLLERNGDILAGRPDRLAVRWGGCRNDGNEAVKTAQCSVDGSGAVYAMPGMELCELVRLLDIARLCTAGETWKFEITKESARRAFAAGWTPESIAGFLEKISGRTIPQTLTFDLGSWKRQFDSVRLYRGYFLALDDSARVIAEKSGALSEFSIEKIGEGLYFISGGTSGEEIEKAMVKVGLPAPSLMSSAGKKRNSKKKRLFFSDNDENFSFFAKVPNEIVFEPISYDDDSAMGEYTQKTLLDEIAQLNDETLIDKAIVERVERKLVYTKKQLHDMVDRKSGRAESSSVSLLSKRQPNSNTPCAGGLDFGGKLRIIQSALDSKYSKLEVKWMKGEIARTSIIRPTSLHKIERDWEMEGEDLDSGKPIVLRVGSISFICREKGFFLGEK